MLHTIFFVVLIALILTAALYHHCDSVCGDVLIPHPFGIGTRCSEHESFAVTCNTSSGTPRPILNKLNLELIEVDIVQTDKLKQLGRVTVNMPNFGKACLDNNNSSKEIVFSSLDLSGSPFRYDGKYNVIASIGCGRNVSMYDEVSHVMGSCGSSCGPNEKVDEVVDGCNGYYCCHANLKASSSSLRMNKFRVGVTIMRKGGGNCGYTFFISRTFLAIGNSTVDMVITDSLVPVVLTWVHTTFTRQERRHEFIESVMFISPVATVLVSCGCCWSCWLYKTKERRKEARLRAKYFKGRLAEHKSSSDREVVDNTKLYTIKELNKATENFNGDRVIGHGGQGTVFKGMLTNGQVIAVKRSKTFDDQWMQFINEVILLSQINHRNVVKLLGCCLETKSPLLVYEFIPNGTLFEHIHTCCDNYGFALTWENRVRVACETAGAIAYLHSSSSVPIYHRDIKSTNILLDEKYQVKVSDFGISKAFSVDQTHMTTCVRGTFGYLDPEYFRSNQFTEKSDVYSFGVVLVELLTGQQPIREASATLDEDNVSLVYFFLASMNESTLDSILDPVLVMEGGVEVKEDVLVVANLAKRCLNSRGIERPTMKEVYVELERLRKK